MQSFKPATTSILGKSHLTLVVRVNALHFSVTRCESSIINEIRTMFR